MRTSCAWCHEANDALAEYCWNCGHEAHSPRFYCCCERCSGFLPPAEPPHPSEPLPEDE
jgi:hypothetical protein